MDGRRFPTEPWMASRKIPDDYEVQRELRRGRPFSLVTFFWVIKRK
ncbi:hypothetical protein IP90_01930 [Luteimonas cucumeris]|uniref:Uncharacterized protein n=1 Tax=Luteimonas cucumeris TaxID=985012 RepID=A0A562L592_9GAMM|nr:hypothetical protein IP90_01930 [Luteimonas cucumeris]